MSWNPGDPAAPPPPAPAQEPAAATQARTPRKGLIWLLAVILVVLLAGAGVGTALLIRSIAADQGSNQAPQPQPTPSRPDDSGETTGDKTDADDKTTNGNDEKPPVAGPLVIPDCATLNPIAQQATQDMLDTGAELVPPPGEVGVAEFDARFGPAARTAMQSATQLRGCYYVFNFHEALYQFTAEIEAGATASIIDALRAEPAFVEGAIGSAPTFVSTVVEESPIGTYIESVAHTFHGNVWVSLQGSTDEIGSRMALEAALFAVVTANPGIPSPTG